MYFTGITRIFGDKVLVVHIILYSGIPSLLFVYAPVLLVLYNILSHSLYYVVPLKPLLKMRVVGYNVR
jgi:hypothetical protein